MADTSATIYEIAGGAAVFRRLVDEFYARVAADPRLRPMFPDDLEPGKQWQVLFLTQYFGGPTDYAAQRGHPRLRMRHAPFPIDQAASAAWLEHMLAAIEVVSIPEPARSAMREYFERGVAFLVNTGQTQSSDGGQ